MGRVVVAYSGGIDSTLVLAAAVRALGPDSAIGAIGVSPSLAARELDGALEVARSLGARVERVATHELEREAYRANGPDRCYHCKTELYSVLGPFAAARGIHHILDGTNAEDRLEFRPGRQAALELGVRSPLLEVGFGKRDIRELSREWGVQNWQKPASPCLSSRVPHFTEISVEMLHAIDRAEAFLASLGFEEFRVRHHGDVARLEVQPGDWHRLLDGEIRSSISARLKECGFRYVSLDLDGFRSGSLNPIGRSPEKGSRIALEMPITDHSAEPCKESRENG